MVKDFPNVEEVKDIESLMKMLDFGRVDIVITSYIGALSEITKKGYTNIESNKILSEKPLYIYFHEKNRDFVAPIEAITKKKCENGELK